LVFIEAALRFVPVDAWAVVSLTVSELLKLRLVAKPMREHVEELLGRLGRLARPCRADERMPIGIQDSRVPAAKGSQG
jgi:hypothetical protein